VLFWSSLFAWGNVPYVVAMGAAVGFALLQLTGILGALAGDGDGDAHGDMDADADGDVDTDADADGDSDGDGAHGGLAHALLVGVGVGKAPLFVLGETFAIVFAIAGIAMNVPYAKGGAPAYTLLWTLPLALVVAFVATRLLASALGRLLVGAGEASSRAELVGLSGVVISSRVDREFGEVRLRDKNGHVVRVVCRSESGEIGEGREVVVVDEDARDHRLVVTPLTP
jgi:membrane protein implicated in regulation of membrane protease activity